jgi:hypothetical protein
MSRGGRVSNQERHEATSRQIPYDDDDESRDAGPRDVEFGAVQQAEPPREHLDNQQRSKRPQGTKPERFSAREGFRQD